MSDGYNSNEDDDGGHAPTRRHSSRKVIKKEVFELKDEPTIKRTKKFKVNPDGSPIVPGYPQTYHAVLAGAVATGAVSSASVEQAAQALKSSADGSSASGSAAAPGLVINPSKKRTSSKLYCFCQKQYDEATPMIQCDDCKEWYHFSCLGVTDEAGVAALEGLATYKCPNCVNGTGKKSQRKASSVGKKRKSKRNDDDDAASEEEADVQRNALGQPIDPADPTWVNPYAELLADKARSAQYTQSQLDQMRQFMNYNRAAYQQLQQQIAAQQAAAQQAALAAQQQAMAAQTAAAGTATAAAPADASATAAAPAAAAPASEAAK